MTYKKDSKKIKILKIELTPKQWIIAILLIAGISWSMFNLTCSINTKFFSASVEPAIIQTDHVKINTKVQK